MGPSLLLLGCFQFVQQHRLCGRHPWSRRSAPRAMGSSRRQDPAFGPVDWPSLMALYLKGRGQSGSCGFSFSTTCRKAEKTHLQREWGTKQWRGEQRRERDRVGVAAFIPDGFPSLALTLTEAQLDSLSWSSRRNSYQLPLAACIGLNQS